ncbi:tetratricopeptide repeat protein [Simiduia agarivorans]|uniref:Uncharacterized protein n=1 Tax=Simiduia agarivorans (strain DSM 21679 / JCM 13881 / BCRC 17597 / SA1) TaxID=1117647 RepID=K4KGK9_SIMAS|nr:tetratricopeptide repeat protein [Simiduia agarivorans]AFU98126.1 hypothetical protein M5M_04595 [Simiduia agarivorans SA1 = DSM 21679]
MNDNQALPWWQQSRVQYGAIAGLIALLVFVVFILPSLVEPVALDQTEIEAGMQAPTSAPQTPADSPFADAQLARERKQAQEILSKVIQLQDQLEGMRVRDWAGTAYQAALDTAVRADEFYRQREFAVAQENYRSALTQLEQLQQRSSNILTQQLSLGDAALQNKQTDEARTAFELALAIDPQNNDAQQGLASAEVQTELLALLRKGRQAEKTDHWDEALSHYKQAYALDPRSPLAQDAVTALTGKIQDRDFNQAMSEGFKALDGGNFETARKSFKRADNIRPGDDSVTLALQQVANQSTLASIQHRVQQAMKAEQEERWIDANTLYRGVLETDATVVEALVGKLRTDARADLEKRTLNLLAQPLQLNKPEKLNQAQAILQELTQLGDAGPKLIQQRQQVNTLLEQVTQPRQVVFRSDNLTQVTVYHVGKLGAFAEQTLALKPGNYVAVGSRQGFRDVREEFTVALDATQVIVDVRCKEKIALGG